MAVGGVFTRGSFLPLPTPASTPSASSSGALLPLRPLVTLLLFSAISPHLTS